MLFTVSDTFDGFIYITLMLFDVFVVTFYSVVFIIRVIYTIKCLQSLLFSTCVEAHLILSFV